MKESKFEPGWYQHKNISRLFINPLAYEIIWSNGQHEYNSPSKDEEPSRWRKCNDISMIIAYLPDTHILKTQIQYEIY